MYCAGHLISVGQRRGISEETNLTNSIRSGKEFNVTYHLPSHPLHHPHDVFWGC
jgi:hypothetical protein